MTASEHRFHHRLRSLRAGSLSPSFWLSVLTLLALGQIPIEAQPPTQSDLQSIFEVHFEADSVRVVRNEVTRESEGIRGGLDEERAVRGEGDPAPNKGSRRARFPFPTVANNQAKRIVWFIADGTIR